VFGPDERSVIRQGEAVYRRITAGFVRDPAQFRRAEIALREAFARVRKKDQDQTIEITGFRLKEQVDNRMRNTRIGGHAASAGSGGEALLAGSMI
jgi:hypothetical protein